MTEPNKPAPKKTPKGGRKGGTTFPRLGMADALNYSKKLVSKTHTGPQPVQTVLVGVFNNKGPEGGVRASALKQYGLLQGDSTGYEASPLARQIEAAVPEERAKLVRQAFLTPKMFKQVYETLQSETASRARVRQAVLTAKVHLDSADDCIQIFIDGAVHAGLGTMEGDSIVLGTFPADTPATVLETEDSDTGVEDEVQDAVESEKAEQDSDVDTEMETETDSAIDDETGGEMPSRRQKTGVNVNLNLNVDSSSDPEKLQKQLRLLKKFGVI